MSDTFAAERERAFPERLVTVLDAGQRAGGDARGQQSAALLVVRTGGGFGGYSDRAVDLRVDDHTTPIDELARLLRLHRARCSDRAGSGLGASLHHGVRPVGVRCTQPLTQFPLNPLDPLTP